MGKRIGLSLVVSLIFGWILLTSGYSTAANRVIFNASKAINHISYLSKNIGLRREGTVNEQRAVNYIKHELEQYGYKVNQQHVPLPNNTVSHNVIAYLPGQSSKTVIVGGHLDSKGGPGANDNASGVGTILELARIAKLTPNRPYSIKFVLFGAEERLDSNSNHHHFGSRHYVKNMSAAEKASTIEMLNVDMVGYGSLLCIRALGSKPTAYAQSFIRFARARGISTQYKAAGDDSDFEAFQRAGLKTVWLEWRYDSNWHTKRDTLDKINRKDITATGKLLQDYCFK